MLSIEPLQASNASAIALLAHALWPDSELPEMIDHFSQIVHNPTATAFLAKDGVDDVGFVELSTRSDYVEGADASPVAYIEGIYVKPSYERNGVARRLVQEAEQWARSKGHSQICSDTELENSSSIKFHRAVGFEEASRIVCFVKSLKD